MKSESSLTEKDLFTETERLFVCSQQRNCKRKLREPLQNRFTKRKVQKKTLSQVLRAVAVGLIGLCSNAFTWSKGKTEYTSAIPFLARLTTIASENSCEVANFLSGFAARLEQIINIKMYYYE